MAVQESSSNRRIEEAFAAGKAALDESRYEEAAAQLSSALRMGPSSLEEEALIRCHLSQAYERRGMNREQFEVVARYENSADFARLSEPTQMRVLIRLAWAHSFNSDIPRAVALFNQAMQIARDREDDARIGDCYFGLGRAYRFVSEIRIARDHYTSALEYYRRVGTWRDLAECYFNIGNIDAREGDFQTALNSIKQSLAIIGDRTEHDLLGRAYNDLALIYDNLGVSTHLALETWERCIEHFRRSNNSLWLAINYNNLAIKLVRLGEWARAEELAKQAIDILRETSRLAQLGGALDTLAQVYVLCGRLDEALALSEESLQNFAEIKEKKSITKEFSLETQTQITIGRVHYMRGDYDKAVAHFRRSTEIGLRLGDKQYLADSRLWEAECLLEQGQVEDARHIIRSVNAYLQETPDMLAWGFLSRVKAKLDTADNHLASAIQSLEQSTSLFELKDSVFERGVNRLVLATIHEKRGDYAKAVEEVELGLETFERVGAAVLAEKARRLLGDLRHKQTALAPAGVATAPQPLTLASALDGFIAQRLVQASVSRELLLHELASVAQALSAARAAAVYEATAEVGDTFQTAPAYKLVTAVGLTDEEKAAELEFVSKLPSQQYASRFIFPFTDNQSAHFLLRLVAPNAERFLGNRISIAPLLTLVAQGLENQALRSRSRRTRIFNPVRLLAEVELPGFVCASRAMNRVLEQLHKIRSSDVTVLITGESGTGKELIARAVHQTSSRRANYFIPFNCSAAPREMVESQLFGYRKGAFTGAATDNRGIIRTAEHGTLFLDEIGDLPLDLQPKLLRFLQEGEVHPLGENRPERVDVRVVAATNADLERAVAQGKFREDLFHRLNVIRVQVPALRERREEIPALLNHYIQQYQQEAAKTGMQLSEETVDLMVVYDWPGNVRQLCNEVRRLVAYGESGSVVTPEMLSEEIVRAGRELKAASNGAARSQGSAVLSAVTPQTTLAEATEELEKRMIREALSHSGGNIAHAAKQLGLSRKGLYLKMDRLKFKN